MKKNKREWMRMIKIERRKLGYKMRKENSKKLEQKVRKKNEQKKQILRVRKKMKDVI